MDAWLVGWSGGREVGRFALQKSIKYHVTSQQYTAITIYHNMLVRSYNKYELLFSIFFLLFNGYKTFPFNVAHNYARFSPFIFSFAAVEHRTSSDLLLLSEFFNFFLYIFYLVIKVIFVLCKLVLCFFCRSTKRIMRKVLRQFNGF